MTEREQLPAAEVAAPARPAEVVTSWVGRSSGHADVSRAAWSGRAALHTATAALIARWAAGRVPAEQRAALRRMIRSFQGPLPELLDAVRRAG
ncbi:hypothetical protein [Streptomyces sp. NPDC101150]|uniref:hypothetical protein n=1 Tax=Streptomyces sp. NPDC101150 TaxID=3366114 RepID=UPI00380D324B